MNVFAHGMVEMDFSQQKWGTNLIGIHLWLLSVKPYRQRFRNEQTSVFVLSLDFVRYREDCRSTTSETAFGWSSRQGFPRDHSGRLKYTLWSLGSPFGPHSFMTTRMQPPHPHPTPVSDWIESKSSPCSSLSSITSLVIWKHLQIITFFKETPLIRWPNQSMYQSGTF